MSEETWGESIVFTGRLDEHGHVKPDEVNKTKGRLVRWKGRRVTVTVSRYVKRKTPGQLGLYFRAGGILDAWCDYIGDERKEVHHDLKDAYLKPVLEDPTIGNPKLLKRVNKITGAEEDAMPSLADLNSVQMSAYITRVLREGALNGIVFDMSDAA